MRRNWGGVEENKEVNCFSLSLKRGLVVVSIFTIEDTIVGEIFASSFILF